MKIEKTGAMCKITKRVVDDFNSMNEVDFFRKYSCKKSTYYRRVKKYGDPYMNAPLAKIGKLLSKMVGIKH